MIDPDFADTVPLSAEELELLRLAAEELREEMLAAGPVPELPTEHEIDDMARFYGLDSDPFRGG